MNFNWTEDNTQELRRLCAEGSSAGAIAKEFNTTRNAIIGKASRLGLKLNPNAVPPRARHETNRAGPVSRKGIRLLPKREPWKPPPRPPKPKPRVDLPLECSPCTVADLTDDTCHWPLWAGHEPFHEKRYCGAMTIAGQVYCLAHWRVAKQPKGAR